MALLNKHFKRQFDSANCSLLPEGVKNDVLSDFEMMSHLGIDNDEDQNRFFLVRNHVPEVLHLIFNSKLNDKTTRAVTAEVFRNREKVPIGTLLELIEAIDLALKKMVPPNLRPKIAYPQPGTRQQLPQYDIGRWVDATRKIYNMMVKGYPEDKATESVIGNWQRREKMDYEQWLRFYREGTPDKYPKLASDIDFLLGGFPLGALRGRIPNPTRNGQGHATKVSPGLPQHLPQTDVDYVRDKIETQRKKLVSRLNAAEKMLASMDGQLFAGDDQELMLKMLQDLKRRIQTANKRTVKSSLFEDHIYRTANQLRSQGKDKAAGFFYKLAQLPPLGAPPGAPPTEDIGGGVGEAAPPPTGEGDKKETHDLLKEFFDNLKRGVSDKNDEPEERRMIEKEKQEQKRTPPPAPAPPAPPEGETATAEAAEEFVQIKLGTGVWQPLAALAQIAPVPPAPAGIAPRPAPAARPAPPPPPREPVGDITPETPEEPEGGEMPSDNTDDVIEAALKNVNIEDVVNRLEMLVSIYNQREISRQLAILDIMMDRIGLASFFPQLGEAMSKALEANQYIGNRLQEVLGKVKGSMEAPGASEWIEVRQQNTPETEGIRQRLEQKNKEEEKRRELRKERELAKMEGRAPETPTPATQIGDAADLQRPSRVEKAPRLEVR